MQIVTNMCMKNMFIEVKKKASSCLFKPWDNNIDKNNKKTKS